MTRAYFRKKRGYPYDGRSDMTYQYQQQLEIEQRQRLIQENALQANMTICPKCGKLVDILLMQKQDMCILCQADQIIAMPAETRTMMEES
jgi:NMD protein affecting ribosome stability and mRNA decay